jgi:HK97 gp10 family phage protein
MPNPANFRIIGLPEFEAQLRELDFSLQRKGLIEVAQAGARILVDAARALAPRDSGRLSDGIKMRVSSKESDIHEATVDVGPDARQFYAAFVERGTKERVYRHGRRGSSGHMTAHPFLGPAFEASVERMTQAMKAKMQEIILRVTK